MCAIKSYKNLCGTYMPTHLCMCVMYMPTYLEGNPISIIHTVHTRQTRLIEFTETPRPGH